MTDLYKEQYKKETEQIHAPAELIARTKAAMREEEARILQGTSKQAAELNKREMPAASGGGSRGMTVRRWAYPLTAAAALLILVSVSMTMRGFKSRNMASGSEVYEEAAADMAAEGMSGGAASDGGMAAEVGESTEVLEEPLTDEEVSVEADLAASSASPAESEDTSEQTSVTDALAEKSTEEERSVQEKKDSVKEMDSAREEAICAEDHALTGGAAAENISIEKVADKPDFCKNPDIETYVFEGEAFQIAKIDNQWAAYVETKEGSRYVLRGEADDVETFLEAGYQKLLGVMSD